MCDFDKEHTICFTGHRTDKLKIEEKVIRKLLKKEIISAIDDNITVFLSGMAEGFDIIAAETVIHLKKQFPKIKLVCVLPFEAFGNKRTETEKLRYNNILKKADKVIIVSEHYSRYCFQKRNAFMVNNSVRVISAYNGSKGGTQNTINYANRKNIEVINILLSNAL